MRFGEFLFCEYLFGVTRGYKVFLRASTPPNVETDTPVAIVDDLAELAALDVSGLAEDATYFGAVLPFNEFGDAVGPVEFSFITGAGGAVQLVPDVVRDLRAVSLAGGYLRISWIYAPVNAEYVAAEDFTIDLTIETLDEFSALPLIDPVDHREPQQAYAVTVGPISDGLATVRVYSRRAGLYEAHVPAVQVRTDATPPAAVALGAGVG